MKNLLLQNIEKASIDIANHYYDNKPIKIEVLVKCHKGDVKSSISLTEFVKNRNEE